MTKLLEFLIYQLKTLDGYRGTGSEYIRQCLEQKKKREKEKAEK